MDEQEPEAQAADPGAEQAADAPIPFRRYVRYFLGLGTWGFGGPIATVGYMQRDLVERKGWISRGDFLDGVAYLYVRFQGFSAVQWLFYGIAPAVMAIIALAAVKLARLTNAKDLRLWVIAAVIMGVTALTGAEIAILFIAAGLVMVLWDAPPAFLRRGGSPSLLGVVLPFSVFTGIATAGTLVALGLFFLKAGAFIFGSGLAIVPFLREGVVDQHHWLTERQFLDAVAIGLISPGPVVITAAFIGYIVGGVAGAGVSTVAIFLPIYLGVVVPGGWFIRHRGNPQIKAFVKGATAAAAGAIAGATIVLTRQAVVDFPTAGILVASLLFVWRFKNREPFLVLLAGAAGILMKGL